VTRVGQVADTIIIMDSVNGWVSAYQNTAAPLLKVIATLAADCGRWGSR